MILVVATVILCFLPGGYWFTLGGRYRWLWGFPFPLIQVHGETPHHGVIDWRWLSIPKNALVAAILGSLPIIAVKIFEKAGSRRPGISTACAGLLLLFLLFYGWASHEFIRYFLWPLQ